MVEKNNDIIMKNITLEELLEHLENGKMLHSKFNIEKYNITDELEKDSPVEFCGTAGCAFGEMPALDKRFSFSSTGRLIFEDDTVEAWTIGRYFNINVDVAFHLFFSNNQDCSLYGGKELTKEATKEDVIYNIKEFLKRQK